jgi:hypothetical protein
MFKSSTRHPATLMMMRTADGDISIGAPFGA